MSATERNEQGEIMVLGHTPWSGYKKAFLLIFGSACLYLAIILFDSLQHLPKH